MESAIQGSGRYSFDNAQPEARDQLGLLSEMLDAHSFDVLARAGVGRGWCCLDLGAGAGTVAVWLRQRVGPTGEVVALDKDPRHIQDGGLVVRAEDVATADLGQEQFDLIHVRLLLMHIPDREAILDRVVASLRPGGVAVLSDWDCGNLDELLVAGGDDVAAAFLAVQRAMIGLGVANGVSVDWARRAPAAAVRAGLVDVRGEVHNRLWRGGEAGCLLVASNSRQLEEPLRARGISDDQLATVRQAMHDPSVMGWSYPMVTTVGRRPT